MDLSVVTTLYQSAAHLREFHARTTSAVSKLANLEYEIIFVHDGSPDDSLPVALELQQIDPHVVVVDLSRNFGHHRAIMTGLDHVQGRLIWLLDCDLEEPPEQLERFWKELHQSAADVVYGQQVDRRGGWFEKWSGTLFYCALNVLSPEAMPRNPLTMRLMTRRYVDSVTQFRDREVFLLGILTIAGYRQIPLPVAKGSQGQTSYDLRRRIALLVNAVTSFSNAPLIYIFYVGMIIFVAAFASASYLVIRWLAYGEFLAGWPSLIASIWLLGGGTIMCIGIIGIYLAKVFTEVKSRPYTVVRAVYPPTRAIPLRPVPPQKPSPP